MFLYFHVSFLKCLISFILFYYFKKYKMSLSGLLKLIISSFSFRTSSKEMSSFVSSILRDHFEEHYRSLLECRDRSKCNNHFSRSDFSSSHLIPFLSVLTDINCLLNCYLVEMTTDSSYLIYFSISLNFRFLFSSYVFVVFKV